ncbi:MAG: LPXTG cell wall anchor domain-containing protein, partial [Micrococcales bacterium]|nr:LPXTG cell wall anchor domain-containing protein [Micrococcales bacterium]
TAPINNLAGMTQVLDAPHNAGFELPLTGGTGVAAIYLAGALILTAGIVLVVQNRRRSYQG